jgi:hypothetical protein
MREKGGSQSGKGRHEEKKGKEIEFLGVKRRKVL